MDFYIFFIFLNIEVVKKKEENLDLYLILASFWGRDDFFSK